MTEPFPRPVYRAGAHIDPLMNLLIIKERAFILRYMKRTAAARCFLPTEDFIAYIAAADLWKDLLKLPVEMHDPVMIVNDINTRFRSKIIRIHMYIPVRRIYYIVLYYYSIFCVNQSITREEI